MGTLIQRNHPQAQFEEDLNIFFYSLLEVRHGWIIKPTTFFIPFSKFYFQILFILVLITIAQ